ALAFGDHHLERRNRAAVSALSYARRDQPRTSGKHDANFGDSEFARSDFRADDVPKLPRSCRVTSVASSGFCRSLPILHGTVIEKQPARPSKLSNESECKACTHSPARAAGIIF